MKKYHIKTWGCQMNVYDSQRIGEVLTSLGYEKTEDLSESDIIILNTCHIREKATEKVYSDIGRLKVLKERRQEIGKSLIIGISGCVAQAEGKEIIKRAPIVDLVFGPQTWHKLKDMIKEIEENNAKVCNTDFPVEEKFESLPSYFDKERISAGTAFVAIQEGCDKFCTYCVVPYTRGAEYSRPTWQILNEIDQLVKAGAKEITLLGQNVNAYHGLGHDDKEWTLGQLIRTIAKIKGVESIRYITSYPAEVNDDLINAHKDVKALAPFLHLPLQSGSNRILKQMNRNHTVEFYLQTLDKFRKAREDIAFSSDFIVGFPNESDEDFQGTLDVIEKVKFIQSFSFIFSPRPGTPASFYEDNIDMVTKEKRLQILQGLLAKHQQEFNQNSVGREFEILLDRKGKKENQFVGKSPYMQAVIVENNHDMLGKIVKVKITEGFQNSLLGKII